MKHDLLNPDNTILLIIDIQEKLLTPQFNKEKIVKNSAILAHTAKILNLPVILSEQYPKGLGSTIGEIKDNLPENGTEFIEKTSFDCCIDENFNKIIKKYNRKQILVCGMESHVCVHQTVYSLLSQNYDVYPVQDAISSRHEAEYKIGITRMLDNGAIPCCTEMALFELIKDAKHPKFKEIQGLIK